MKQPQQQNKVVNCYKSCLQLSINRISKATHIKTNAQAKNTSDIFLSKCGAASVIRTRDLTLTKGALYRWSYGSIMPIFRFFGIVNTGETLPACHRKTWAVTSSLA